MSRSDVVGPTQGIGQWIVRIGEQDHGAITTRHSATQIEPDRFVPVIGVPPTETNDRFEQRRENSFGGTERRHRLAHVVQQRRGDLGVLGRRNEVDETARDHDRMPTIGERHRRPQGELAVGEHIAYEVVIDIGDRRTIERGSPAAHQVPESTYDTTTRMGTYVWTWRHDPRSTDARGWAREYCSNRRSCETLVYTCVVEIDAWPNISWTMRRSAP